MTVESSDGRGRQVDFPVSAAPVARVDAAFGASDWVALLLAIGVVAYLPALHGVFTFDDYPWLLHNERLDALDPWLRRPVAMLTFAANLRLGGQRPVGFHLVNIALHLANTALVFRLLVRTLAGRKLALVAAAAGAGLFMLHPAQTDAVTYVSGRTTALMTFFLLLAHLAALRSFTSPARRWRALSLVSFALAVGAKEIALVYPLLWWTWLVFARGLPARQALRRAAPHFAIALLLVAGMLLHPGYRTLLREATTAGILATTPVGQLEQRLGLGLCFNDGVGRTDSCLVRRLEGLAGLTRVLIAPWQTSIDHGRRPVDLSDALLVIALLLALAVALRARPGPVAAGAAWAFAALLPTDLLLVRSDPVADRLLYLPLVGVALVAAVGVQRVLGCRRFAATGAIVVLLTLGALTWWRNLQYGSEIALWRDAVAGNASNPRALVNLGFAYELAGESDAAARQYRRALVLEPGSVPAWRGLDRVGVGPPRGGS